MYSDDVRDDDVISVSIGNNLVPSRFQSKRNVKWRRFIDIMRTLRFIYVYSDDVTDDDVMSDLIFRNFSASNRVF